METIYKAFDGEFFFNKDECIQYEKELTEIRMFSKDGQTDNPHDDILFVHIPYYCPAKTLKKFCQEIGASESDIDGYGYYVWAPFEEKYIEISKDTIEAIQTMRTEEG